MSSHLFFDDRHHVAFSPFVPTPDSLLAHCWMGTSRLQAPDVNHRPAAFYFCLFSLVGIDCKAVGMLGKSLSTMLGLQPSSNFTFETDSP